MPLSGKKIVLIIAGGIAAYKSLDLIRRLQDEGAEVTGLLTEAAKKFVTPLSVTALSGRQLFEDLFAPGEDFGMAHISLSRRHDLMIVAPATADLMAKMALGLADDLASTALLASDKPILIAPAMNSVMWGHAATQHNLAILRERGVAIVGPGSGDLACGEVGDGRMAEVPDIVAAARRMFEQGKLAGKHALVTSGPTFEAIDPVRFIGNRSSGKQGHAIAEALRDLGARVTLVSGPVALRDPDHILTVRVESAREMEAACFAALPADIAICAAAVADWRTLETAPAKLKKQPGAAPPALELIANPDILAGLAAHAKRPRFLVGFAAETEDLLENALKKRSKKGCDLIVANDVSPASGTFGGDASEVTVIDANGAENWPLLSKREVARRLAALCAERLA